MEYQERIGWALQVLEEGADSESLRVLASLALKKHPNPWEVDSLFRRSLAELGWSPLRREELGRQRARDLCEDILSGKVSPKRATHELYRLAVDLGYPRDLSGWIGLDDAWDLIGVLYASEEQLEDEIWRKAKAFVESTPKKFF